MHFKYVCTLGFIGILLSMTGCSRYRLGFPVNRASFRTIYVAPAVNKAFVSQAQSTLTRQVREEILRNGYLKLQRKGEADVVLEMTIVKYGRSIGAVYESDPDAAKTLSMNLTVSCSLKDTKKGCYLFRDQSVSYALSISANDYAQCIEYQRLPQLTREVAKKIVLLIENTDA
ncbi:MAG: LPS assembly lipoprotein LptE [Puniceicoccales bacterium]|nr:LPS assembly lipoprotein LptE [Puniceicoccales bacterium]